MICFNMVFIIYYSARSIFFIIYQRNLVFKYWYNKELLPIVEKYFNKIVDFFTKV